MSDTRSLNRAVKWLYEKDDGADQQPQRPKEGARCRGNSDRTPSSSGTGVPNGPDFARWGGRHDRKCCVCRHPQRAEIEQEFLHWRSPESIAKEYGIAHHSSVYRHARATNLFAQRSATIKLALAPLIEQAMVVPVTANSVVRAVVAFAHINDEGQWVDPPRRVIHESRKVATSPPDSRAIAHHPPAGERKEKANSEPAPSRT